MPWMIQKDGEQYCVHMENEDGSAGDKVKGGCHPSRAEAETHMRAMYAEMEGEAMKYRLLTATVKALSDWRLDVNPVPFGSRYSADSDGQWFDSQTDIMEKTFNTPLVIYQHGVQKGARSMAEKPMVIGESIPNTWNKQTDGWHIEVLLDSSKEAAQDVMNAAYKREVAVSSDSISHLARLEIGGRLIPYEKNRAGRIAVWPLAGFSLWELGGGNARPANRAAFALPAMKAMYREAGVPFPVGIDTYGVSQVAGAARRAEIQKIKQRARAILDKTNDGDTQS